MYTYLGVQQTNNSYWAHAVVTVGYEEFTYTYTEKVKSFWFFGWHYKNVTRTKEYNYLRTIDGWGTSNSNQYVDMNSFYSSLGLKSLNLTQRK